ncbi:pyridoxal-phosphate dependent enzyme [Saccharopolyspora sp. NPDC000995]
MFRLRASRADQLRRSGRRPYVVGMGAERALTLAAFAYVEALCEIVCAFEDRGEPLPTHIYTTSQGSTQAGLQLGAVLLGLDISVVGINPMDETNDAYIPERGIADLVSAAAGTLGYSDVTPGPVVNDTSYVRPAYGIPSDASREAIELLARREGLLVDPIYSGKGFAGQFDHVRTGLRGPDDRVVFVHTGGLPALFAEFGDG